MGGNNEEDSSMVMADCVRAERELPWPILSPQATGMGQLQGFDHEGNQEKGYRQFLVDGK